MRIARPLLLFVLLFAGKVPEADGQGTENVPLRHWAYEALERFESLGLLWLSHDRPYSRRQMAEYVASIRANSNESAGLGERDRFQLGRLEEEFLHDSPPDRYDRPVLFASDEKNWAAFDLFGGPFVQQVPNDAKVDPFLFLELSLLVQWGDNFAFDALYDLVYGPERGDRAHKGKPFPRTQSWHGLVSEFQRGYLRWQGGNVDLVLGREEVDWGPSNRQNLLLSRKAKSLDQVQFSLSLAGFNLNLLQGRLAAGEERWVAAHRLDYTFGRWLVLGLSESVVYEGRFLDPAYIFPFSWFYANQWNERADDNILWSFDAKLKAFPGTLLYGELLIDDLQFEDDPAPDKLGYTLGARAALARGFWTPELQLEYTRIDIYTYSHKDSLVTRYLTGDGDPEAGNTLIGNDLGPDADRWRIELGVFPAGPLRLGLQSVWERRGEGNDLTPWERGLPIDPPFPSGSVEKTWLGEFSARCDVGGGGRFAMRAGLLDRVNREGVDGDDSSDGFFRVDLFWDF